jgi:hypothetical protein
MYRRLMKIKRQWELTKVFSFAFYFFSQVGGTGERGGQAKCQTHPSQILFENEITNSFFSRVHSGDSAAKWGSLSQEIHKLSGGVQCFAQTWELSSLRPTGVNISRYHPNTGNSPGAP